MAKRSHKYTDRNRGDRIQKVLAEAGVDSRRHCEDLIHEGRVRVNGTIVDSLPAWVDPIQDRILVDGKPIRRPARRRSASGKSSTRPADRIYIMLNKPSNVVCTNSDPEGRTRAIDLVLHPGRPRLFCVGRLDADSTGLLLLTNDGDLANRLTHPSYGIHKEYEVVVKRALDAPGVEALQRGIFLHDRRRGGASRAGAVRLRLIKRDRNRSHLHMELREGRNRQIRRMMAHLGHPVKKLKRVKLGPLRLTGLPLGHWRPLKAAELRALRRATAGGEQRGKADVSARRAPSVSRGKSASAASRARRTSGSRGTRAGTRSP